MNSFAWLWVLLCASNFLSSFAHENPQTLRSRDFLISSEELSLSDLEEHGTSTGAGTGGKLKLYTDSDRRKLMASENITLTENAQRGKGSYGGANIVHRRPPQKSSALLSRPHFFVSSTILGFSFSLLLAFPFPLS
ncbi:hypothetical protein Pfo_020141 [Paulownia fortunei]|nr:hypothetical protein Pfo_020141 [Paulownia fortunei]